MLSFNCKQLIAFQKHIAKNNKCICLCTFYIDTAKVQMKINCKKN